MTINILHLQLNCKIILSVNTHIKNNQVINCREKAEFYTPNCISDRSLCTFIYFYFIVCDAVNLTAGLKRTTSFSLGSRPALAFPNLSYYCFLKPFHQPFYPTSASSSFFRFLLKCASLRGFLGPSNQISLPSYTLPHSTVCVPLCDLPHICQCIF